MKERSTTRDFDWWLLFLVVSICALGILDIYFATRTRTGLSGMHWRQLAWVAIGMMAMVVMSRIDYHAILEQSPLLYMLGLTGLALVLIVGKTKFGTKGWLAIGGLELQVSELVKLIIIIVLARFFSEVRTDRLGLLDLLKAVALTAVPIGLIMKQPDFGTAMMILPALGVGAFLCGLQWKHVVAALLIVALLAPVGWLMLKDYQKQRILVFLEPDRDLQGSSYQSWQSKIAIGSGGFWGKGLGNGSQSKLGFLPVGWSDFVFASHAEETGFIGVLITLTLYLLLLLRLVQNAKHAVDRSGMYLVMGVAAIFGIHYFWNVAMAIGYLPITGIPLPLMSYGGSATLFVFMALGLVMNVRMNRFVN